MPLTPKTRTSIFVFGILFLVFLAVLMVPLYGISLFPVMRFSPLEMRLALVCGIIISVVSSYHFSRRIAARLDRSPKQAAEDWNAIFAENLLGVPAEIKRLLRELRQAAEEQSDDLLECAQRLAIAVDNKDPYTSGHSARVTHYSVLIAKELDLPEQELRNVRISAQLHDIGKIAIDDAILKKPGVLSPEEFEAMKRHPIVGANLLRPIRMLREALPGVEFHHESLDGRGYPHGLKGEQIPRQARIITVADTFDAMTTDRPYQTAMEPDYVLRIIHSLRGTKYDEAAVAALVRIYDSGGLRARVANATPSDADDLAPAGFDSVHALTSVLSDATLQIAKQSPANIRVRPQSSSLSA